MKNTYYYKIDEIFNTAKSKALGKKEMGLSFAVRQNKGKGRF